jgi:cbb3-type cytochrome oxidase subunit 3
MNRALALIATFVPAIALACPVCGQGREGSGTALLVMSIILTCLPLGMIGGVSYWAYRRVKRAEAEEALLSARPQAK